MQTKLAYRIESMKPMLPAFPFKPGELDGEAVVRKVKVEADMIARSTHLCFNNVAQFYAQHPQQIWDMEDDFPNWAPPFKWFFAEWDEPNQWNTKGGKDIVVPEGRESQAGFFVMAMDLTEKTTDAHIDALATAIGMLSGFQTTRAYFGEKFPASVKSSKWMLCCSGWMSFNQKPLFGAPLWAGLQSYIFVADSGRYVHHFTTGIGTSLLKEDSVNSVQSPLNILGLGLSFCHCKNVRQVEHDEVAAAPKHKKEQPPRIKYYTLDIGPMREVLKTEGGSESVGLSRALHICRGHFATYSEDHPLFGKYVGTFWRPDHVRGKKEAGEVHKRYAVSEPRPDDRSV